MPANATNVSVNVTATDSYGLATTESFALNVAKPPVLANQTTAQLLTTGKSGSFTLAANTFTDPQGGKLTYTATQADGSPLPSWLAFNAATGAFTGTPPAKVTSAVYATNEGCGTITSSPASRIDVNIKYIASLTPTAMRIWVFGL